MGVISEIFCHGLMSAALTSGPGDLGHSSRQRALSRPRMAPTAARKLFVAAIEIWWLSELGTNSLGPRVSVFCLGAKKKISPPPRPPGELCGRGWCQCQY
jgi:hypothetical protein